MEKNLQTKPKGKIRMTSNAKITIIGKLVHDPVIKQVGASDVCNFTVAVNTSKKEDGTGFNANFYDCSYWNDSGKFMYSRIQKGTQVVVFGDLEVVNRKNLAGENIARLRVDVKDMRPVNGLRGRDTQKPDANKTEETEAETETEDVTE